MGVTSTLTRIAGGVATHKSSFHYVPNVAIEVLDNDEVEEVVFTRDEDANVVWAFERLVTDDKGARSRNGDGRARPSKQPAPDPTNFRLASDVPAYWIPYVPRFRSSSGDMYLRRGRTIELSAPDRRQFKSKIVEESWRLEEAEIPRTGVRVRRIHRFARGSDGVSYFWVGRYKMRLVRRSRAPS